MAKPATSVSISDIVKRRNWGKIWPVKQAIAQGLLAKNKNVARKPGLVASWWHGNSSKANRLISGMFHG
jgi:hypothetical protein